MLLLLTGQPVFGLGQADAPLVELDDLFLELGTVLLELGMFALPFGGRFALLAVALFKLAALAIETQHVGLVLPGTRLQGALPIGEPLLIRVKLGRALVEIGARGQELLAIGVELPGELRNLGRLLVQLTLPSVELLLQPAMVLLDEAKLLLALGEALAGGLVIFVEAIEPIVAFLVALGQLAAQLDHLIACRGQLLLMALPVAGPRCQRRFLFLDGGFAAMPVRFQLGPLLLPLRVRLGLLLVALLQLLLARRVGAIVLLLVLLEAQHLGAKLGHSLLKLGSATLQVRGRRRHCGGARPNAYDDFRDADRQAIAIVELSGNGRDAVDQERQPERELAEGDAAGMAGEQADQGRQLGAAEAQIAAGDGADEEGDLGKRVVSRPTPGQPDLQRDIGKRVGHRPGFGNLVRPGRHWHNLRRPGGSIPPPPCGSR